MYVHKNIIFIASLSYLFEPIYSSIKDCYSNLKFVTDLWKEPPKDAHGYNNPLLQLLLRIKDRVNISIVQIILKCMHSIIKTTSFYIHSRITKYLTMMNCWLSNMHVRAQRSFL